MTAPRTSIHPIHASGMSSPPSTTRPLIQPRGPNHSHTSTVTAGTRMCCHGFVRRDQPVTSVMGARSTA